MSRRPSWRTVSSTSRRSSSAWRTLVGTAIERRPVFRSSVRASSSASGLRAAIATSAPCSASPIAMERPMPRLPPVTMATLPAREKSAMGMRARLAALEPGFEQPGVAAGPMQRPDGDGSLCLMAAVSPMQLRDARTRVTRSGPDQSAWELWQREPLPALRGILRGLWAGGAASGMARHRVLPNGEVSLMLHVGPAQRAVESDGQPVTRVFAAGFVAGLQQRPYTIESPHQDTFVVAARIRPECVATLFPGATPSELVGQVESASDLLGSAVADGLCGRMRESADLGGALDVLEAWLLDRTRAERLPRALTCAASARIAAAGGNLRVDALSRELGISPRRMNELFQNEVGVQAKRVARIARFRGTLGRLHAERPRSLAGVAQDSGYYDEAHLCRDFRELALLTPTAYLAALGDGLDGPEVIAG